MVLQDAGTIEIVIPRTISKGLADLSACEDFIVDVLPLHGQWRQMPIVRSGNSGAVGIGSLMTGSAVQARYPFTSRTADNVE